MTGPSSVEVACPQFTLVYFPVEKEIKVALRVHTDLLSKENVGQFWNEDMTMRFVRLKHFHDVCVE